MKGKREKPLGLDMPFDEALARFLQADRKEVEESIEREKKGRPKPPEVIDEKPAAGGDGGG